MNIFKIYIDAISIFKNNFKYIFNLFSITIILFVILLASIFSLSLFLPVYNDILIKIFFILILLFILGLLTSLVEFSIAWHTLIIKNEAIFTQLRIKIPTSMVIDYIVGFLALSVRTFIYTIPFIILLSFFTDGSIHSDGIISDIINLNYSSIGLILYVLFIFSCLSIAIPALIDNNEWLGGKWAWKFTKGNRLKVFIIIGLIPAIIIPGVDMLVDMLFSFLTKWIGILPNHIVVTSFSFIIEIILNILLPIFEIILLSLVYMDIKNIQENASSHALRGNDEY